MSKPPDSVIERGMGMSADDKQVAGNHYRTKGVQHWTVIAGMAVGYLEGCCTKYILRWRDKNGAQDLEKAQHFLEKLIEMVKAGSIPKNRAHIKVEMVNSLIESYPKLSRDEAELIRRVICWKHSADLDLALTLLKNAVESENNGAGSSYVDQDRA